MVNKLRDFLWTGADLKHTSAKLIWDMSVSPLRRGGSSIRRLDEWNKAFILKYIWAIHAKKDSLWVKCFCLRRSKGRIKPPPLHPLGALLKKKSISI